MTRWLPFPLLSFALAAMWLMLNGTLEAAHLLLAALLGWLGGLLLANLQLPRHRVHRRLVTIAALFWLVFLDIVRSNVAVARIALKPGLRGRTAGFLAMPLEVRHPGALAILACIITATPGTIWMSYKAREGLLLIHVFDLIDEDEWIRTITQRYEAPLREIFE